VIEAIRKTGATVVKIDAIGLGAGLADRLSELGGQGVHSARIVPVNVSSAARNPKGFVRRRDEIWWNGRLLSERSGWDLRDVDELTIAQLTAPRFTHDSGGRVRVEAKDETRGRLGRSPDDADALLLAFYTMDDVTDPAYLYRIWTCKGCEFKSLWEAGRRCKKCGERAPFEDPFPDPA